MYDFYKLLHQYVNLFPKSEKYTLGRKLKDISLEILELIIQAGYISKEQKTQVLNRASVKLDLLKILIRLSLDIKALDNKKYLKLQSYLQEIGKMLGGWIRSTRA